MVIDGISVIIIAVKNALDDSMWFEARIVAIEVVVIIVVVV